MIGKAAAAAALVLAGIVGSTAPAQAAAVSAGGATAQLVAKLYTEALGRLPDAGGWAAHTAAFAQSGCSSGSVAGAVRAFYLSPEFLGLPYSSQARVLALYRGALNREPDDGGLDAHSGRLDSGAATWPQIVDAFVGSSEFAELTSSICGPGTGYQFGTRPAATPRPKGSGFQGGTGAELQAVLDSAPPGATVVLAQMAVVRLDETLVVPAGKTLATEGLPAAREYADQGRLVRAGSFGAPMVRLEGGARLRNVWVDGQRGSAENYHLEAINVQVMGGDGGAVTGSKLSNSRGWSTLQAFGSFEGLPCRSLTIADNVVTAYSSENVRRPGEQGRWTDGLSVSCEGATVRGNGVVDATDVGIVIFRASPAVQRSVVRDNVVLSAGNSAFGAIGVDGLYDRATVHDFSGTSITHNAFWSGPDTHFEIGIAVGTRPWFGDRGDTGTGASVTDNTTSGQTAVVGTGIAVSGMNRARVQGNDLRLAVRAVSACPHLNFGVDADGHAEGGDFQPGATPAHFTSAGGGGCISG
ncbi:DUF4214 domain-containing protein [Pseudonocardia sp. CA-107938]|uniref:DUF4214 domain-containing protein n=1 Tax=Pseudonocardia sp. CA-107938 TaxID=3240021 RepID=UPI003D9220F1